MRMQARTYSTFMPPLASRRSMRERSVSLASLLFFCWIRASASQSVAFASSGACSRPHAGNLLKTLEIADACVEVGQLLVCDMVEAIQFDNSAISRGRAAISARPVDEPPDRRSAYFRRISTLSWLRIR